MNISIYLFHRMCFEIILLICVQGFSMNWYKIPKIKKQELYDEQKNVRGVLIKAKDFEKLIEKMEDFYDIVAADKVIKSKNQKFFTLEEINEIIESKK